MRPDDQLVSKIMSTKGSLMGRSLLKRMNARPSGRRCSEVCRPDIAGLYSKPAAVNASGGAMLVFRDAASSALMSGTSISARRGSPKADWTVKRPNESALAPVPDRPNSAMAAAAIAVFCQRCDLAINFWSPVLRVVAIYCHFTDENDQLAKCEKYLNINVLA